MSGSSDNRDDKQALNVRTASRRLAWALAGGVFILDAFILRRLVADQETLATISALAGLLVLLWPLLGIVLADLRKGQVRMNELVLLAVLAGASQGDFLTAGVIAFFMLLGLIVESRTAIGAKASIEALARLSPGKARRLDGAGNPEEVEPAWLRPGDLLQIRPGENVLADGEIVQGDTSLQEANITGESLPVDKGPGTAVFAGTVNLTGAIRVRVTRAGEDTTLGKVRQLILNAEQTRLPVARLMDKYVHFYTPVVLMLALVIWIFTNDLGRIVALLVAACPIALVLATPSVMVAALSAAARLGVLIKNVGDLELMARIDAFIFDKTGTLTTGTLAVARLAPAAGVDSADLLRDAAGAEQQSNHPVAKAVCRLAAQVKVPLPAAGDLHEEPGRGIRAGVGGDTVLVGNLAWMQANGLDAASFPACDDTVTAGMSLLFVSRNGRPMGWIGLRDELRPEAAETLAGLHSLGMRQTALVTGDRRGVAAKVAAELGITDWRGECVPAEKVEFVEHARAEGLTPAFVGDGVNDGPALAASAVGIALGAAGSDVAIESASIALMNNDLRRLPFLVELARAARAGIIQNFCIGGILVAGGVALSAAGLLSPVPAAIIQVGGALAVVLNSARLIRRGEDLQ